MADSKRIAKNTLLLYFRMILIMGVTLYTSRVILDKLGVDDYGLYSVVGGVVGMLSFINGTLSIGTLRFLTYELGKGDDNKLRLTFNTAFYTHFVLSVVLAIVLESGGLWFVYHKLVIPPDRFHAALIAYHISVFTSIIVITQVPYTSLIIAHERMGIYAYISIFEAVAKLGVVYLLAISTYDKLIVYAVLIAFVQFLTALFYRLFCVKRFPESRLGVIFDRGIFKLMMGFSGWNIAANLSETLKNQGCIVLLNLFFQPVVVTAQTIGNQVAGAMMQFINNFRTAINPQIIKHYAVGEYEESKRLTLTTTILVFDLVLLIGLPTIFVMNKIMEIWLVEVPAYAVVFTQYIIIQRIIGTFDAAFYIPMMAASKIKTNSLFALSLSVVTILLLYFLFRIGCNVMYLQYVGVVSALLFSFLIKPCILVREVKGYHYRDFLPVFGTCCKVALVSVFCTFVLYKIIGNNNMSSAIILSILSALVVCLISYLFLERTIKTKIKQLLLSRIKHLFHK